MVELEEFCINSNESILSAFKKVDINGLGILFVIEDGVLWKSNRWRPQKGSNCWSRQSTALKASVIRVQPIDTSLHLKMR